MTQEGKVVQVAPYYWIFTAKPTRGSDATGVPEVSLANASPKTAGTSVMISSGDANIPPFPPLPTLPNPPPDESISHPKSKSKPKTGTVLKDTGYQTARLFQIYIFTYLLTLAVGKDNIKFDTCLHHLMLCIQIWKDKELKAKSIAVSVFWWRIGFSAMPCTIVSSCTLILLCTFTSLHLVSFPHITLPPSSTISINYGLLTTMPGDYPLLLNHTILAAPLAHHHSLWSFKFGTTFKVLQSCDFHSKIFMSKGYWKFFIEIFLLHN